jgi:hypothetical protein
VHLLRGASDLLHSADELECEQASSYVRKTIRGAVDGCGGGALMRQRVGERLGGV